MRGQDKEAEWNGVVLQAKEISVRYCIAKMEILVIENFQTDFQLVPSCTY